MKDMVIPATKQVIPGETFLANLVTNGIDMAFVMRKILVLAT